MSKVSEAKAEAKELGIEIGKITAKKDRLGYYDVFEDGLVIAESGLFDSADEAKADAIQELICQRCGSEF